MNQHTLLLSHTLHSTKYKKIAVSDPYGFYSKRDNLPEHFGLSLDDIPAQAHEGILKVVEKVLYVNIPALLTDGDISPATLQSCVDKLNTIIKLLGDMVKVSLRSNFLKSKNSEDLIQEFLDISTSLKGAMVDYPHTGPSALAWNVRKPKLWYWCRTMLEHTQNPLCELVNKQDSAFSTKLAKLHDVNTQLIMNTAFGDDVSDNLRDKTVTDVILRIPFASKEERAKDLAQIQKHRQIGGQGAFTLYYRQAIKVWDDALDQLSDIFDTPITQELLNHANQKIKTTFVALPETGFEAIVSNPFVEKVYAFELPRHSPVGSSRRTEWSPFQVVYIVDPEKFEALSTCPKERFLLNVASHFRRIMKSMAFSLQMNINPHAENLNSDIINQILPYNMMVNWFRFSEDVLALSHIPLGGIPAEPDLLILRHIIEMSQLSASISNSIATLKRELEENDLSNVFFFELNEKLEEWLRTQANKDTTSVSSSGIGVDDTSSSDDGSRSDETPRAKASLIHSAFTAFIKQNGYTNHFFSHYGNDTPDYPPDLLELLLVRRYGVNQLYTQLNSIFAEAETDTGSFKAACEHLGKTNSSFQTLLPSLRKSGIQEKYETLRLYFTNADRFLNHIELIDSYTKEALSSTGIIKSGLEKSDRIYHSMVIKTEEILSPELKEATRQYCQHIARDFLFMYLLFKQNSEGEI